MNKTTFLTILLLSSLSACGGKEKMTKPERVFDITLTNVTANQPLSPAALVLLSTADPLWQVGMSASIELEGLAESGHSMGLLASVSDPLATVSATEVLMPGHSQVLHLQASHAETMTLTVVSMLANTNDAFTGVTGLSLMDMEVGQTVRHLLPIYDAGTEANTEALADVPGPAAGGEGYNSARDDVDYVAYHPGVVTSVDGLSTSVLDGSHKFDQGGVIVLIERSQ